MTEPVPLRPPFAAVAMLSAAALGFEVLLMRLFAVVQWHHFAYLAISAALLGFGAAGSFVTLNRSRLLAAYPQAFCLLASAFALGLPACFAAAERVPFNALEIAWNPRQFIGLAAIYALLFLPFFCAAAALCLAYVRFGEHIPRLYGADILGAGCGSVALLTTLFLLHPADVLRVLCALGLAAAALAAWPAARRWGLMLAAASLLVPVLLPAQALQLIPSDYKDLRQALRSKDSQVVAERFSPLGVVTVVDSPLAPLRYAPGLSLNAAAGPPPQLGLFVDGQAAGVITRFDGAAPAYLADMTSALPYALLESPRVLVLGAGGGGDVLQALLHGARQVDAVELDRQVTALVEEDLVAFSGRPFSAPGVRLHVSEARGFIAASPESFDLIQVALLDAFATSAAGLGSLSESNLYTLEAVDAYLDRLAPAGLLAFTRWLALPPRDSLRLFATAASVLERRGVTEPGRSLAMIRSWNTVTLLVKNGVFAPAEIAAIRAFCRQRSFDLVHLDGLAQAEANVFNLLERDDLYAGARALLGPARREFY